MPGLPPAGPPRLDLPASLGGSLPPPRGSDPLMSLGPSAPSSGAPLRAPSVNDKVIYIMDSLFRQKDNLYIICHEGFLIAQLDVCYRNLMCGFSNDLSRFEKEIIFCI